MKRDELKPIAETLLTQARAILESPGQELELIDLPRVAEFGTDDWAERFWLQLHSLHRVASELNRRPPEADDLSQQIERVQRFSKRL